VWDLTDLYPSPEAWNTEYAAVEKSLDGIKAFKGKLATDARTMLSAFDAMSAGLRRAYRLYGYASLKSDEDVRIAENTERKQKAQTLFTKYTEATSWVNPEVLAIGATKVAEFQSVEPGLRDIHGFTLADILRTAPHTLSPDTEAALAPLGDIFAQPNNVYSIFVDGELPYPTIRLSAEIPGHARGEPSSRSDQERRPRQSSPSQECADRRTLCEQSARGRISHAGGTG
jgi:oligoendopeptidase F